MFFGSFWIERAMLLVRNSSRSQLIDDIGVVSCLHDPIRSIQEDQD